MKDHSILDSLAVPTPPYATLAMAKSGPQFRGKLDDPATGDKLRAMVNPEKPSEEQAEEDRKALEAYEAALPKGPEDGEPVIEAAADAAKEEVTENPPVNPEDAANKKDAVEKIDAKKTDFKQKANQARSTSKRSAPRQNSKPAPTGEKPKVLETLEDERNSLRAAFNELKRSGKAFTEEGIKMQERIDAYGNAIKKRDGVTEPASEPIPSVVEEPAAPGTPEAPIPATPIEEQEYVLAPETPVTEKPAIGFTNEKGQTVFDYDASGNPVWLEPAIPSSEAPIAPESVPVAKTDLAFLEGREAEAAAKLQGEFDKWKASGAPEESQALLDAQEDLKAAEERRAQYQELYATKEAPKPDERATQEDVQRKAGSFDEEFEHPEKPVAERIAELELMRDKALKVMEGASLSSDRTAFDTAGRTFMDARRKLMQLGDQEVPVSQSEPVKPIESAPIVPEIAEVPAVERAAERTPTEQLKDAMDGISRAEGGAPEDRQAALAAFEQAQAAYKAAVERGRTDRAVTLDDRIEDAKRALELAQGRARPLETAHQKQEINDLREQQLAQLVLELEQAKGRAQYNLEAPRIQAEIDRIKAEQAELNKSPGWFSGIKKFIKKDWEKTKVDWEKTKGVRGFLWERTKGLGTAGIYEVYQGYKVRVGTAEVGKVAQEGAKDLWTEGMLQEQAEVLARRWAGEGASPEQIRAALDEAHQEFVVPMRERNNQQIDRAVVKALAVWDEKMANRRTAMTGAKVSGERREAVAAQLREALVRQQQSLTTKQSEDYVGIVRRTFDPKWKWRYVFGAAEAAILAGVGIKYLTAKALLAPPLPGTPPPIPGTIPPGPPGVFENMHGNIWTTLKNIAARHGKSLDPQQLMELSKQVIADNHLYEPQWAAKVGNALSTRGMQEGAKIILSKVVQAGVGM